MANLGKYEILDEIGKGGFGTVYRARDTVLDRLVALKVLKPAWLDDREAVSRFYREARSAAKLHHPNIVTIYDMGEIEGKLFIAMELMDGDPLDKFIEQRGHLTLEQALPIIEDTASALAFAHANGLVHRDVKPDNILVRKDGRALLTDFGLVRGNEQASIISLRTTGNALGTPEYIAPELWEENPPSAASDTYSLACVIYQMLTGKVLHAASNTPAVMRKHFAPADLSQVANERARAALASALTIDPANRAGMDALVAGLKDAAKPVVIPVAPPPPPLPDPVAEARERANELFLKGRWSEAGAATKAWLALAPSDTNAQVLLNKITQKLQGEDVAQRVAQAKDRAKAMFAEGKWEEAINAAKSWLALAPNDNNAKELLSFSEKNILAESKNRKIKNNVSEEITIKSFEKSSYKTVFVIGSIIVLSVFGYLLLRYPNVPQPQITPTPIVPNANMGIISVPATLTSEIAPTFRNPIEVYKGKIKIGVNGINTSSQKILGEIQMVYDGKHSVNGYIKPAWTFVFVGNSLALFKKTELLLGENATRIGFFDVPARTIIFKNGLNAICQPLDTANIPWHALPTQVIDLSSKIPLAIDNLQLGKRIQNSSPDNSLKYFEVDGKATKEKMLQTSSQDIINALKTIEYVSGEVTLNNSDNSISRFYVVLSGTLSALQVTGKFTVTADLSPNSASELDFELPKECQSFAVNELNDVQANGSTSVTTSSLRIYSSFPLQGANKFSSDQINNAIAMAIGTNTQGGLVCNGKYKIDFVRLDDSTVATQKWDAGQEQANATKAVSDKDVIAYIGTLNSGAAKVAIPILNQANIAMISPANTYDGLTKAADVGEPNKYYPNGKGNYMRVVPFDGLQGAFAAQWAKGLGAKSVYILDDAELYGKGLASQFEKTAKSIGLNVLGHTAINGQATNYKTIATAIQGLNPDLIYFGGITDNNAGQLLKDIRGAGVKAMFMGADGIKSQSFINAAGAGIAEGTYASIGEIPKNKLPPDGLKFQNDFMARFNVKAEDLESYAKYGYAAGQVVLNAINSVCAKDQDQIRNAMLTTKNLPTVVGNITFDANGDTTNTDMTGFIVKNGAWVETDYTLGR